MAVLIKIDGRELIIPTALCELSAKQHFRITAILERHIDHPVLAKWLVLFTLMGAADKWWLRWFFVKNYYLLPAWGRIVPWKVRVMEISDEDWMDILQVTDRFYDNEDAFTGQLHRFIRIPAGGFIYRCFPTLACRVRLRRLSGPADRISDLTMGEFRYVERRRLMYVKTGETVYLDGLIAVLWRDRRKPFRPEVLEKAAARVGRLPIHERKALLHWYLGCLDNIHQSFPEVFPKPKGKIDEETGQEMPVERPALTYAEILGQDRGWQDAVTHYAKSPDKLEALDASPIWSFLTVLEKDTIAGNKMKEEVERLKR